MKMKQPLLRKFDPKNINPKDVYTDSKGMLEMEILGGPDSCGEYALMATENLTGIRLLMKASAEHIFIEPVCWVDGKPAYAGDALVHHLTKTTLVLSGDIEDGLVGTTELGKRTCDWSMLAWPKQKQTRYMNVYSNDRFYPHSTKEEADKEASDARVACVLVEWEE